MAWQNTTRENKTQSDIHRTLKKSTWQYKYSDLLQDTISLFHSNTHLRHCQVCWKLTRPNWLVAGEDAVVLSKLGAALEDMALQGVFAWVALAARLALEQLGVHRHVAEQVLGIAERLLTDVAREVTLSLHLPCGVIGGIGVGVFVPTLHRVCRLKGDKEIERTAEYRSSSLLLLFTFI